MFESIFNFVLFVLAIVGAVRFGNWVYGRAWRWWWKAIMFLVTASAIVGFIDQIGGGQASDLRIITQIMATAGVIFVGEWALRHNHNFWSRAGVVVASCVVIFIMWSGTVNRLMNNGSLVAIPIAPIVTHISPIPVPTPASAIDWSVFCAQTDLSYETRQTYCK